MISHATLSHSAMIPVHSEPLVQFGWWLGHWEGLRREENQSELPVSSKCGWFVNHFRYVLRVVWNGRNPLSCIRNNHSSSGLRLLDLGGRMVMGMRAGIIQHSTGKWPLMRHGSLQLQHSHLGAFVCGSL